jgi:CRISPR/Cas system-associated endoribonuclease Cas2
VFEAEVKELLIDNLQWSIRRILEGDDFFAIIPLCEEDWQKAEKYGVRTPNQYITGAYEIL